MILVLLISLLSRPFCPTLPRPWKACQRLRVPAASSVPPSQFPSAEARAGVLSGLPGAKAPQPALRRQANPSANRALSCRAAPAVAGASLSPPRKGGRRRLRPPRATFSQKTGGRGALLHPPPLRAGPSGLRQAAGPHACETTPPTHSHPALWGRVGGGGGRGRGGALPGPAPPRARAARSARRGERSALLRRRRRSRAGLVRITQRGGGAAAAAGAVRSGEARRGWRRFGSGQLSRPGRIFFRGAGGRTDTRQRLETCPPAAAFAFLVPLLCLLLYLLPRLLPSRPCPRGGRGV